MILQQENNKQCYTLSLTNVTMIKNSRLFSILQNCVSMCVIFFKCVSKFVNCVSNRSNS